MNKEDDQVLDAIIVASIIGIFVIAGLIFFHPGSSENVTNFLS